ncbi:hypothetical protein [Chromobacterium haemolyticum]|uniref:hypothetical protein n=1 Tax=Chromobacterium haemolyticum TaxID=394935 RepID=UPI00244BE1E8|nr:hypothetical protein [Chromobacterium haemolyticum]MDH0342080.1 hypothetical protein [Chromobacterium haemolyticum]
MSFCRQTTLIIDEQPCQVTLAKAGRVTWTANGMVQGVPVHATAQSEAQALATWRRLAEYQANA